MTSPGPDSNPDLLIVGAGTAGITAALAAAARGARITMVEAADRIGGTLHLSSGQMSAAGTRFQHAKGIEDTPEAHLRDILRINHGTGDLPLIELFCRHAADMLHWLCDLGFEVMPEHPVIHYGHEPYQTPRTYWGAKGGLSILDTLRTPFEALVDSGTVTLHLQTRMTGLVIGAEGRVEGIEASDAEGRPKTIRAARTVLTTGGYANSDAMFRRLHGRPKRGWAWQHALGDGLRLAADQVGAAVRYEDYFLPTFCGTVDIDEPDKVWLSCITTPQIRPVREIYVNAGGGRFMAEDETSVDARERILMGQPEMSFWTVFDERMRREATTPIPFILWPDEKFERALDSHPDFVRADSIAGLAEAAGFDPALFAHSVEMFNRAADGIIRDPYGRKHFEFPLGQPPYYAVRQFGLCVVGFGGLACDTDFRVLRDDGSAIDGLYGCGEVLGLGAFGNAYCGGTAVTPALTFGKLLGEQIPLGAANAIAAE